MWSLDSKYGIFRVLGFVSGDGKYGIEILMVVARGLRSSYGEHQKRLIFAVTNEDGGNSIEAYKFKKSHGKKGTVNSVQ